MSHTHHRPAVRIVGATLALALGLAGGSAAWAASWGDYIAAFPKFPCQDGWMGCVVDGKAISPDLQRASNGLPQPADLRIGWDLEATAQFSPFPGLSAYTGELPPPPEQMAAVEPEPEPEPADDGGGSSGGSRTDHGSDGVADADGGGSSTGTHSRPTDGGSSASSSDGGTKVRPSDDGGGSAVRPSDGGTADAGSTTSGGSMVRPSDGGSSGSMVRPSDGGTTTSSGAVRPSDSSTARTDGGNTTTTTASDAGSSSVRPGGSAVRPTDGGGSSVRPSDTSTATTTSTQASAPAGGSAERVDDGGGIQVQPAAAVAVVQDASCDNMTKLEPSAMLGKLNDGQIACLEDAYAKAPKQTDKDKISRILMANAYSKGDTKTWEKLIKRHLEEIDQSDPDLCYKYALHLSKGGAGRASGVIRWANVALENRTVWTGETYTSRVSSLYKLRAAAAQSLWKKAEEDYAKEPSDDLKKKVEENRNQTKVFAREWYEYSKVAGKDTTTALQLCISAAGTKDYCEAG